MTAAIVFALRLSFQDRRLGPCWVASAISHPQSNLDRRGYRMGALQIAVVTGGAAWALYH